MTEILERRIEEAINRGHEIPFIRSHFFYITPQKYWSKENIMEYIDLFLDDYNYYKKKYTNHEAKFFSLYYNMMSYDENKKDEK